MKKSAKNVVVLLVLIGFVAVLGGCAIDTAVGYRYARKYVQSKITTLSLESTKGQPKELNIELAKANELPELTEEYFQYFQKEMKRQFKNEGWVLREDSPTRLSFTITSYKKGSNTEPKEIAGTVLFEKDGKTILASLIRMRTQKDSRQETHYYSESMVLRFVAARTVLLINDLGKEQKTEESVVQTSPPKEISVQLTKAPGVDLPELTPDAIAKIRTAVVDRLSYYDWWVLEEPSQAFFNLNIVISVYKEGSNLARSVANNTVGVFGSNLGVGKLQIAGNIVVMKESAVVLEKPVSLESAKSPYAILFGSAPFAATLNQHRMVFGEDIAQILNSSLK
jgi:hypothetical protein